MEAQNFVDDYEKITETLESLISDTSTEELTNEVRYILAEFQDNYHEAYDKYQEVLETEWEEENKEQLREYWADQF